MRWLGALQSVLLAASLIGIAALAIASTSRIQGPWGSGPTSDSGAWTRLGMVLDVGPEGDPDSMYARDPYLMWEGGTVRMWYNGYDGERNRILYAVSADGISWAKQGVAIDVLKPPYNFDSVAAQTVLRVGGVYRMWFTAGWWSGGPSGHWSQIYYAESPDATAWTVKGVSLPIGTPGAWDGSLVHTPVVSQDPSGLYRMYYYGSDGTTLRIGLATSTDGIAFTRSPPNPVLEIGPPGSWDDRYVWCPTVLSGSPWRMWYSGSNATATRVGLATSPDGVNWTKSSSNPDFAEGAPGTWDDASVSDQRVFPAPGSSAGLLMYYAGSDGTHMRIGLASQAGGHAPSADAGGPYASTEGSATVFDASASTDPDSDPLMFRWDFQDDGTWDTAWSPSPFATFTWGDDWKGVARVEVSDGQLADDATADVTVSDVAPTILELRAYALADVTLRVAGEKWHDVRMDLVWDGNVTGSARIVRTPGSPDEQEGVVPGARLHLLGSFAIVLRYTPDDDPVNGRPNGATPVWVILTFPDGSEARLHHTFNEEHPQTWEWTIHDLRPTFAGPQIAFEATASDPGSDDLRFVWNWGDGTSNTTTTYYNNGVSADPRVSPDVSPIRVTDTVPHAFAGTGPFAVTLTVSDDDGWSTEATFAF